MIDPWSIAANSLWILGLATLLAALSWAHWRAARQDTRLRHQLTAHPLRLVVDLGLLLFCAGLAATSRRTWERILWVALSAAWALQAAHPLLHSRQKDPNDP